MGIEEKIREHLRTYRAKHGKSQKEMAVYLDVAYPTYQEMEKGIVRSVKNLNKLKDKTDFKSDTQETMYTYKNSELGREVGELKVKSLDFQAFINVALPAIADLLTKAQDKEFAQVYASLRAALEAESERLRATLK